MCDCAREPGRLCLAIVVGMAATATVSRADISPPVAIKLVRPAPTAVAGREYAGTFEIRVFRPGDLSELRIEGKGWAVRRADLPTEVAQAAVGAILVPFSAVPADADEPVGLSLRYDGRLVRTLFDVGPAHAAWMERTQVVTRVPGTSGLRSGVQREDATTTEGTAAAATQGGAVPIRVVGRVVYDRPGIDRSDPADGDFDDPGDVAPVTVGAYGTRVVLVDRDVIDFEVIWGGTTDQDGYFDSGVIMWDDCDVTGCDVPDLELTVLASVGGSVHIKNLDDVIYGLVVEEMENFEGDFHDYGWLKPAAGAMPAYHIASTLARAARFVNQEAGYPATSFDVYWPDDSKGDGAWYNAGEEAIHISTDRQWRTDTIIHEFGHHHNNRNYGRAIPEPDYCDAEMDCDPNPPDDCGHCLWCDENANAAWFEGWANWLADVVTRDFPNTYTFDDGTPYTALYTRSQESPGTCNDLYADPVTTEGFVGALLRDMEDETQDDHDDDPDPDVVVRDGVFDIMCLGVEEIFFVTYEREPLTVTEFIEAFRVEYPPHADDLWATAFNVGGSSYIASFPTDTDPPGTVSSIRSSTHPSDVGGSLPCINFEFDPAWDDVKGANFYSYTISTDPAGWEPDTGTEPVVGTDTCEIRGSMVAPDLGDYYISIKAQDNAGNWSSDWRVAGPFEVIDCNNNGIMDVCDVTCDGGELDVSDVCLTPLPPNLCDREGCGQSPDCNGNLIPDICDLVDGTSEDCDVNGVPDECQSMKHWASKIDPPEGYDWGLDSNWLEGVHPIPLDVACIPADSYGATVVFTEADAPLTSLACWLNFIIDGPSTIWPESLELMENSFVMGSMEIAGNSKVTVNDRLYVNERLHWKGGLIDGQGLTEVRDGLNITQSSVDLHRGDFKLLGGDGLATGRTINMNYGATFLIDTQATYTYEGNSYIFSGSNANVDVRGALTRTVGDGTATVFAPLDNSGTVRAMTGELVIGWGGTHTGAFIADPGAALTFLVYVGSTTHELLPASSVTTDTLTLGNGTGNFYGTVDIGDSLLGRGGVWTFADDANIVSYGQHVHVDRGRVVFEAPTDQPISLQSVTITSPGESAGRIDFNSGQPVNVGTFSMLRGSLYGPSPINVGDTFTWTNGSFWGGGAITVNGPVVINATSSSRTISRVLNVADQANVYSGFSMNGGGAVNILDDVVFNIQFNNGNIGGGTVNNFGTILRSAGNGEAGIGATMNNSGLIHNQSGTLTLSGGGTHTGDALSDAGTVLKIGGTGHNFESSSTITTPTLDLSAWNSSTHGSVDVGESLMCDNCSWTFEGDANIVSYGQALSINRGTLTFDAPTDRAIAFDNIAIGPSTSGGATAEFNTGQPVRTNTLVMSNGSSLTGNSPIEIADQFTWVNGNLNFGGAIRCDGASTIQSTSSSRTLYRRLDNYGTMTVLGSFGTHSSGPITNKPGGVISLQYENRSISGSGPINNEGTLIKSVTTGDAGLPNVVNTGTIDVQEGSISFHTSYYGLTQTAGQTVLHDTAIEMLLDHKAFDLQGGLLKGNGSVIGDVNNSGGVVTPGFSAGSIQVDDYTQALGGSLDIEIAGTVPGTFDVLDVTGTATLGGTLNVLEIDGFVGVPGDSFIVMTAADVVGEFDTTNMPPGYSVVYGETTVTLVIQVPGDIDGDLEADLRDYAAFQRCFAGTGLPPAASCEPDDDADLDNDNDVDLVDFQWLFAALSSG